MPKLLTKLEVAREDGSLTGVSYTDIPVPSVYDVSKKDISDSKAGRTASMRMKKMLRGRVKVITLAWNNRSYAEIAQAFTIFDHEYFWLTFFDPKTNGPLRRFFYAGDMTARSYTASDDGIWSTTTWDCVQAQPD